MGARMYMVEMGGLLSSFIANCECNKRDSSNPLKRDSALFTIRRVGADPLQAVDRVTGSVFPAALAS